MPSLAAVLHTTGIATPLSYVGRVGLDRFYNLRSSRVHASPEYQPVVNFSDDFVVFGNCAFRAVVVPRCMMTLRLSRRRRIVRGRLPERNATREITSLTAGYLLTYQLVRSFECEGIFLL